MMQREIFGHLPKAVRPTLLRGNNDDDDEEESGHHGYDDDDDDNICPIQ